MRILQIGTEAIGYRLKEKVGSVDVLSDTLTRIGNGEIVIEPVLAKRLVERTRGDKKGAVASLSERELDVLRLMAEGRSNNGIASQLFVTPKAIEKQSRTSSASSVCTPTPPSITDGSSPCSPTCGRSATEGERRLDGQRVSRPGRRPRPRCRRGRDAELAIDVRSSPVRCAA